ncbi:hypothetical protein F5ESL0225_05940 [Lactobacillus sp. ESL0225]|nr:hypothetical protein F5ESL0225_05940 [Lactobacillus sp. ESL0225]
MFNGFEAQLNELEETIQKYISTITGNESKQN